MDELEQIREQNRWNPDKREEEQEKPKSSLPGSTIALMMITAGIIDAVQAFLLLFAIGAVLNTFISVFMICVYFLWFLMHGVSFITPKRFGAMFGGSTIELIPALNAVPTWLATVGYIITTTRVAEVAEKVPGGKVVSMAVGSKIQTMNTARTTVAETAKAGLSTHSVNKGNVLYMGAKNPQQIGRPPQNIPGYQKNTTQKQLGQQNIKPLELASNESYDKRTTERLAKQKKDLEYREKMHKETSEYVKNAQELIDQGVPLEEATRRASQKLEYGENGEVKFTDLGDRYRKYRKDIYGDEDGIDKAA